MPQETHRNNPIVNTTSGRSPAHDFHSVATEFRTRDVRIDTTSVSREVSIDGEGGRDAAVRHELGLDLCDVAADRVGGRGVVLVRGPIRRVIRLARLCALGRGALARAADSRARRVGATLVVVAVWELVGEARLARVGRLIVISRHRARLDEILPCFKGVAAVAALRHSRAAGCSVLRGEERRRVRLDARAIAEGGRGGGGGDLVWRG